MVSAPPTDGQAPHPAQSPPPPTGGGGGGLQLDPQETNVSANPSRYLYETYPGEFDDWRPENDPDQEFAHSGWAQTRRLIDAAMGRTMQTRNRRTRFRGCGSGAWVYVNQGNADDYRVKANWCHDRFCMVCGAARARHIAAKTREALAAQKPLFITLTIADTSKGLSEAITRLYRGFRILRQTDLWQNAIKGGIAFLEVKYSDRANRWHPHLHILAPGRFLDKYTLSDTWRGITRDSFIVDVERCAQIDKACNYVCKYASKPMSPTFLTSPNLADEAVIALAGRRLVFTFGDWRKNVQLNEEAPPDEECVLVTFQPLGPLADFRTAAARGDGRAIHILEILERRRKAHAPTHGPPASVRPLEA